MPISIVWGDTDRILPRWIGEEMVQLAPNAQLTIFEKCGHIPHEERPVDVAKLVQQFMNAL
jgi:pimeloyl-ACP methyl ester carboxylesterase